MIDTKEEFKVISIFLLYIAVAELVPGQTAQIIILVAISGWAIYYIWRGYQAAVKNISVLSEDGRYVFNLNKDAWIAFSLTVFNILLMLMFIAAIHYLDSYTMWTTIGGILLIYFVLVSVGTYFSKRSDVF